MTTFEIVEQDTILRATVGSTVHGLHHGARLGCRGADLACSGQEDRERRLHAGEGTRGDLLANAEDRPGRQPRRPNPAPACAHRRGHDRGRHEGALPLPPRPASSRDGTGAVAAGDHAIHADGSLLAAVERKTLENLAATLSDGTSSCNASPSSRSPQSLSRLGTRPSTS
jgi:hypothetical protein